VPTIGAIPMDLEPGQSWDDTMTLTLTRQDAFMAMASLSIMLGNIKDGLEAARASADDGDITAILVGPHLYQSGQDIQQSMRSFVKQLLPALWAEVEARDAAEAAMASTD